MGRKDTCFFLEKVGADKPWNRIKTLPNMEIEIEHHFMKDYINIIKGYVFGMLLR